MQAIHPEESKVSSYNRAFPFVIESAKGSIIRDVEGKEYIDFFSGAGANNYGHNPEPLKQALLEYIQADGINNSLDMMTQVKSDFLDAFVKYILQPRGLNYKVQFPGPTGANTVEAALKLARLATGRSNIVSFQQGFHGVSLGALAATSNPYFRDAAGVELKYVDFLDYDSGDEAESVKRLEEQFAALVSEKGAPAGVIVECIQGEGGVNAARPAWLKKLRELTEANGVLLIVDDIQAGCGRSGNYFSFEPAGIVPDVVTQSKSISGFGSPMSLLLIKPEFDIWKPAQHNGTFRGNNHAFVTAKATVETYWKDDSLMKDVERKAGIITEAFEEIIAAHPEMKLFRKGRGFFQGISFADPQQAAAVGKKAFENGLIIERAGIDDEVVKGFPALTIDDETLRKGLNILADSVDAVAAA
jgi:diaminobutyrate-2-oxoglutarate transaminase